MNNELKKIYEENIVHSGFLNVDSVEKCMEESYNLGVNNVLDWLSKMDYLSDNIHYIIEEWHNKNKP